VAYRYNGVECDTLAELNALRQSRGAQPMVAAHNDNRKQCAEMCYTQTGPGMGYEQCGKWAGHKGDCEP